MWNWLKKIEIITSLFSFFSTGIGWITGSILLTGGGYFLTKFGQITELLGLPLTIFILFFITSPFLFKLKEICKELKSNPPTEIILQKDTTDAFRFLDSSLKNILRYNSVYYNGFWDVVILFKKPIGITTIRSYGIDGSKPNFHIIESHSNFVRMSLENAPDNKFKITFNEENSN